MKRIYHIEFLASSSSITEEELTKEITHIFENHILLTNLEGKVVLTNCSLRWYYTKPRINYFLYKQKWTG